MIEVYSVTESNSFAYNNEETHRGENRRSEFTEIARNAGLEPLSSEALSVEHEENDTLLLPFSDIEVVTYTFSGKKVLYGKFSGRNLDIDI